MIEALVSFVLFVIVSVSAVFAVANGIKTSDLTHARVAAANIAQQDIETARSMNSRSAIAATTYQVTVGNQTYTVARSISYSSSSQCPSVRTTGTQYYINITDKVTPASGKHPVTVNAVIAC